MRKGIYIHKIENALGVNDTFDIDMPGGATAITAILFVVVPLQVNLDSLGSLDAISAAPEITFEFGTASLRAMKNRMFIDKLPVKYVPPAYKWNGFDYPMLCKVAKPLSFVRDSIRQNIPVSCGVSVMYNCTLDYASNPIAGTIFGGANYDLKIIMEYTK